jgi:DNA-binding transcriptional ArsR family regulator
MRAARAAASTTAAAASTTAAAASTTAAAASTTAAAASTTADAASESADAASSPDAVLRALADPQRRQMLRLVRTGELAAGQIATHFDITQQAVSHHLHVLQRAGLVHERRDGTRHLYALRPEALDPVRLVLADLWPEALERLKQVVESNRAPDGRSSMKPR